MAWDKENTRLRKEEVIAMEKTVELWNSLLGIELSHEDDIRDLRFHIHAIQNIILSIPEQR